MEMHVFWGLMIPVGFFAFAGMAKSLVKSQWTWGNFYLGIDLALAALANGIVNIVDLVHESEHSPTLGLEIGGQVYYTALCIFVSVGALFGTMAIHQRFDAMDSEPDRHRMRRGILLGIVSNLLGGAVLAIFIWLKLRRQV
jgi:hypothetical protein